MRSVKFFRTATQPAPAGPAPAEMRGRAAEIRDPGVCGWEVIWEALKTEALADAGGALTQELGLDQEREIVSPWGGPDRLATEFTGTRHGRHVALRIGVIPGIRGKAFNEVDVEASVAPFRLREKDGRPVAESGGATAIDEVLRRLAPAPQVWRRLEVEGGPDGIRARRPVGAHPEGYVYDLWLIERLADRLGA